jgi:UDP-N-acetyl-alpha-D-muramoyl-L-alanyl-L-glutamate epimerase
MTDTVDAAGILKSNCFVTSRSIDPQLLSLNNEGFLNGHTPFSSLLAFQSLVYSLVSGIKDIALSNESSANEATVPGTNINHQYSKSIEFESDFRKYVQTNLSSSFNYFSVLRPLSELQIAYIFHKFEHHHDVFRSCNVGSKQNVWCGKCPKCLFTAIMLLPFSGLEKIEQIFGCQIFNNEQLVPILDQLIGKHEVKPFECVGTPDEINMALAFFILHSKIDGPLPYLIDYYKKTPFFKNCNEDEFWNSIKNAFDSEHFLSNPLYEQLQQFIKSR